MRAVRFTHTDRNRTASYRIDFYLPGSAAVAHTATFTNLQQSQAQPPTFDAIFSESQKPAAGSYEVVVTAVSPLGEASGPRSTAQPTEPPLVPPGDGVILLS